MSADSRATRSILFAIGTATTQQFREIPQSTKRATKPNAGRTCFRITRYGEMPSGMSCSILRYRASALPAICDREIRLNAASLLYLLFQGARLVEPQKFMQTIAPCSQCKLDNPAASFFHDATRRALKRMQYTTLPSTSGHSLVCRRTIARPLSAACASNRNVVSHSLFFLF
jgi:hypothetical protein